MYYKKHNTMQGFEDRLIKHKYEYQGKTPQQWAKIYNTTPALIRYQLKKHGNLDFYANSKDGCRIVYDGKTTKELAAEYNLTISAIEYNINKHGNLDNIRKQ